MNSALSPFPAMFKQYYCEYVHRYTVVKQLKNPSMFKSFLRLLLFQLCRCDYFSGNYSRNRNWQFQWRQKMIVYQIDTNNQTTITTPLYQTQNICYINFIQERSEIQWKVMLNVNELFLLAIVLSILLRYINYGYSITVQHHHRIQVPREAR